MKKLVAAFCVSAFVVMVGAQQNDASAAAPADHDHQAGCACGCAHLNEACGAGVCCHGSLKCNGGRCIR